MTLKELAEICKTSVGTLSKAFSGSKEISASTREKIFAAAKQYGCFEKYYKGPKDRPIIGLMLPESESEIYGREIGDLEKAINKRGGDAVVAFTRFDNDRACHLFDVLAYRLRVDGIIIMGRGANIKNPDQIPLVTYSTSPGIAKNSDVILDDMLDCLVEALKTVKEYGHKKVGFIGESLTMTKQNLFKRAMRRVGLPVREKYIVTSDERFAEAGKQGMSTMIDSGDVPTAIIAAYDYIAYGAMGYARGHGYRVPEDISFIGMDDIMLTSYLDIPLSSIRTKTEEACDRIVDLIFKRIENHNYRSREMIEISNVFNLRDSLVKVSEK